MKDLIAWTILVFMAYFIGMSIGLFIGRFTDLWKVKK